MKTANRFFLLFLFVFSYSSVFSQEKITLDDIWNKNRFSPKNISSIRSMADGEHYTVLTKKNIEKYAYKTGKKQTPILEFDSLDFFRNNSELVVSDYQWDSKEEKILLFTDIEYIYRRSFLSNVFLYDIKTKHGTLLSTSGKMLHPEFSPDGKQIAFVRDNNLFVMDLYSLKETPITLDGEKNRIIYGSTDWVYEEEFEISKGFYWSPDNTKIAFFRFDESTVKESSMTLWGNTYPEEFHYKYPKAGENNSKVDVLIYDLESKNTISIDINSDQDQYLPRMQWSKQTNVFSIMRLNRLQNYMEILFADAVSGKVTPIYTEESKTYIDIPLEWIFLNDKKHFLITSEKEGYNHMYLYDFINSSLKSIDKGDYDVIKVSGIDERKNRIYYISSETSPLNKELYSIQMDGSNKTKISKRRGSHKVSFNNSFQYYINQFSDANTPPNFTINDNKGNEICVLENNAALKDEISRFGQEEKEFGIFTTSSGQALNYWLIKPSDFDSTKQYPVLFYVYGGPGSQTVTNSWGGNDYFWFKMLAQKGYVCISVDGRGTGNRGEAFKKVTYKSLGKYELQDQIEAAEFFGNLPWVNKERIGIYGWSFGGYMSSLCITLGAEYFKTAIAVAPVTSWKYYDNVYTERFMQRPKDNESGYEAYSPIQHAHLLKGNFLLVHGTADDNVHFQNAMDFSSALIQSGKTFEQFFYPNKNHFIRGGNTRFHLFSLMTSFLEKNL